MSYARIKMSWPKGAVEATLEDTPTARALVAALPVKAKAQTWGEEVYFEVPVKATLESGAKQVVPPGTVCLWVEGSALALPWGRTPVSEGDESRLVTAAISWVGSTAIPGSSPRCEAATRLP